MLCRAVGGATVLVFKYTVYEHGPAVNPPLSFDDRTSRVFHSSATWAYRREMLTNEVINSVAAE